MHRQQCELPSRPICSERHSLQVGQGRTQHVCTTSFSGSFPSVPRRSLPDPASCQEERQCNRQTLAQAHAQNGPVT